MKNEKWNYEPIIKEWFLDKNHPGIANAIWNGGYQWKLIKETEKAVNLQVYTDFGKSFIWVPKSCLEREIKESEK